ncbi:MAG TPA: PRC-barrel domain-containing protein [Anaerolineales bacterium]|nr:PRC-barrel domain-containing protein [Anaerolineales bacterium]
MLTMFEIEVPVDAVVHAIDGACGHVGCVIVDPIKEQVTHLVVQDGESPQIQRLVPVDLIHSTRQKEIEIKCGIEEFKKLPAFAEAEFLLSDPETGSHRLWPYVESESSLNVPEHERLPAGEVAIRRGTAVHAKDGPIGIVDELMINRQDGSITHVVLREGHLWGTKDISIPVSQIEKLDQNTVYLRLSKQEVEALPEIRIRRFQH